MIEETVHVAVRSCAPMLLMGPTGAGKSFLARRIFELKKIRHQLSGRFVEINCATLHGDGAASPLFGHVKGAFTGAATERPGLLRTAHKGLLFLDEIGELGLDEQASAEIGHAARFNKESRAAFLRFATSPGARWKGNFRDLHASVTRMATLAEGGRITTPVADAEIGRLHKVWREPEVPGQPGADLDLLLGAEQAAELDLFDKLQLRAVVQACSDCASLSDAGRKLFGVSRLDKAKPNDADRLKKFLARHGLAWDDIREKR